MELTDEVNKGCEDTGNGCHAGITNTNTSVPVPGSSIPSETETETESVATKDIQQREERTSDDSDSDSFPQDIKDTIATLRLIVDRINSDLKQARDLILEIARLLDERRLCERGHISIKIKEILEDKIRAGKITERWIRKCLPQEYKREYVKDKRELSSLSKKPIPVSGTTPAMQQEQDKEQVDLAAEPELKQEVVVQASGQEAVAKPEECPLKTQAVSRSSDSDTDTALSQSEQSTNTEPGIDSTIPQPQRSEASAAVPLAETTTEEDTKDQKSQPTTFDYSLPIDEVLEYLASKKKDQEQDHDRDKFYFCVKLDRPATIVGIMLGRVNGKNE